MRDFRREAAAAGVTRNTLADVLDDMTLDPSIIARDRRQSFFGQSFVEFRGKLISRNRITNGQRQLEKYRPIFARAEKDYGVPGSGHHRLLGARKRLRRRHGQAPGAALAGDARL